MPAISSWMEECELSSVLLDVAVEWSLCRCLCFVMDSAPTVANLDLCVLIQSEYAVSEGAAQQYAGAAEINKDM